MESFVSFLSRKLLLVSLIAAVFIIYPNIICLPWELVALEGWVEVVFVSFFLFRILYFWMLFMYLIRYNLKRAVGFSLKKRFVRNFEISAAAYIIYLVLYLTTKRYGAHDFFGSILIFQFFVVCSICTLIGHISMLNTAQQEKELEIERLKTENLKSRCDALANQINPHFFFNSLGGISSLVRKKDEARTLQYVDELSDIFRYILQSDRKGIVTLREELNFIEAFRYVMEVRFANKLSFCIDVDECEQNVLTLPVLSLLPVVDNVVVHNMIDIDHKMTISIRLNERSELVISNPIYPKSTPPKTNGTGIKNLDSRFALMKNRSIRVEETEDTFTVYLPLK
jgi:sensor histidine kinase YesM